MTRLVVVLLAALALLAQVTRAQTFTGPGMIINDAAPATPYPSVINVSGIPLSGLSSPPFIVTLHGFSHNWPSDVYAVLEAPSGQLFTLMGRCGGSASVSNVNLSFTSTATISLSGGTLVTGTYLPTGCVGFVPSAPLPLGPFGSDLTTINPASYVGQWKLFVGDAARSDVGSIASWSITFPDRTVDPQSPTAFTYQGFLAENGVPFNGPVQLRFALMDAQTDGTQIESTLVANVNVAGGVFTTPLDFGPSAFHANSQRFLQIYNGQAALSPRQLVSPAPRAISAHRAQGIANPAGIDALALLGGDVVSFWNFVAPEFRYHAPSLGVRSLHSSSFTPSSSTMTFTRDANGLYGNTPGAVVSFAAPLDIPSGATLQDVTVGVAIPEGAPVAQTPVTISLVRVLHPGGGEQEIGRAVVNEGQFLPVQSIVQPNLVPAFTIDNNQWAYAVVVSWTTPNPRTNIRLVSGRVRYSIDRVAR
jgi:hypothetical protein